MIKFDKLMNEPYLESLYIQEVFLNPKVSPSDISMHSAMVTSNSICHLLETSIVSNFRFILKSYGNEVVADKDREPLIKSLIPDIENNCLFKVYQESRLNMLNKNKSAGFEKIIKDLQFSILERRDFDLLCFEDKIRGIEDKNLHYYAGDRNVAQLINWLKENNQNSARKLIN